MKYLYETTLECRGFGWSIRFEEINRDKVISGQMLLKIYTDSVCGTVSCVPFFSSYNDMLRLTEYFDNHIIQLAENSWHDSDVFVQYGLEFQIQALCGLSDKDSEGDFTIRIMLAAGKTPDGTRVYIGAEGCVDIEKCRNFKTEIVNFLNQTDNL